MTTSTRFNSPEYLSAWRTKGIWPSIHDAMADFAAANMRAKFLLDLGCSYGLLGARIGVENGGLACAGVEADEKVIQAAQEAGVPLRFYTLKLTRATLPAFAKILVETRARAIVARRILPELWGEDREGGAEFVDLIADLGVREILVEGRIVSERATNPLRSIDDEVALLSSRYREAQRAKALSYLVLR